MGCIVEWLYSDIVNLDEFFGTGDREAGEISRLYQIGANWWRDADDSFKTIIGAREFNTTGTLYECTCIVTDPYTGWEWEDIYSVSNESDCNGGVDEDCFITGEIIQGFPVEYESDGIVTAPSAMGFPGADVGPDNALIGSNHQQMRNDSNLEQELDELFRGDHGDYFITN